MSRVPGLWLRPAFGSQNEALAEACCALAEVVDVTSSPAYWCQLLTNEVACVAVCPRLNVSSASPADVFAAETGALVLQTVSCLAGRVPDMFALRIGAIDPLRIAACLAVMEEARSDGMLKEVGIALSPEAPLPNITILAPASFLVADSSFTGTLPAGLSLVTEWGEPCGKPGIHTVASVVEATELSTLFAQQLGKTCG